MQNWNLELAVSSPECLSDQQLTCVRLAVRLDEFVPVPFAEPFADRFMANPTHVNLLHPVGKGVLRCLAACALAERDDQLPQTARSQLDQIGEQFPRSSWANLFRFGTTGGGAAKYTNVRECIAEVLQIVEQHQLMVGFVAPELPDFDEWVPTMQNEPPTELGIARQNIDDVTALKQPFGRLITEWPPTERQQPESES